MKVILEITGEAYTKTIFDGAGNIVSSEKMVPTEFGAKSTEPVDCYKTVLAAYPHNKVLAEAFDDLDGYALFKAFGDEKLRDEAIARVKEAEGGR